MLAYDQSAINDSVNFFFSVPLETAAGVLISIGRVLYISLQLFAEGEVNIVE